MKEYSPQLQIYIHIHIYHPAHLSSSFSHARVRFIISTLSHTTLCQTKRSDMILLVGMRVCMCMKMLLAVCNCRCRIQNTWIPNFWRSSHPPKAFLHTLYIIFIILQADNFFVRIIPNACISACAVRICIYSIACVLNGYDVIWRHRQNGENQRYTRWK